MHGTKHVSGLFTGLSALCRQKSWMQNVFLLIILSSRPSHYLCGWRDGRDERRMATLRSLIFECYLHSIFIICKLL
jgi:hypothetical protein